MTRPNTHDPLVESIRDAWTPEPVDAKAFDERLHLRLRSSQRRRAVALGALATVAVLVAVSHLLGGPASEAPPVRVEAAAPPVSETTELAVAARDDGRGSLWFGQALDPAQRSYQLPGAYGALDALFLQPSDQEL